MVTARSLTTRHMQDVQINVETGMHRPDPTFSAVPHMYNDFVGVVYVRFDACSLIELLVLALSE